jgi:protein-L-isoaspartate(D-aspartate) O-methyltransferase
MHSILNQKKGMNELGYKPRLQVFGDGYKGLPNYAPFDKIIVTAGAPYVPEPLVNQLKTGRHPGDPGRF